jgi:hypothetical protein
MEWKALRSDPSKGFAATPRQTRRYPLLLLTLGPRDQTEHCLYTMTFIWNETAREGCVVDNRSTFVLVLCGLSATLRRAPKDYRVSCCEAEGPNRLVFVYPTVSHLRYERRYSFLHCYMSCTMKTQLKSTSNQSPRRRKA